MLNIFFKSIVALFILAIGIVVWPLLALFWFANTYTFANLDDSAQVGAVFLFIFIQLAWIVLLAVAIGNTCNDSVSVWC